MVYLSQQQSHILSLENLIAYNIYMLEFLRNATQVLWATLAKEGSRYELQG